MDNPIPGAQHPMCDCMTTTHETDCFFFDEYIDGDARLQDYGALPVLTSTSSTSTALVSMSDTAGSTWKWHSSCKHNMSPFHLPSGLLVHASAWRDVPYSRTAPDVGVYLDAAWFPADCYAYALGWQDFGLPTVPEHVVARIGQAVLNHAEYGETIEIGCLGAHGRTGSFLALLVLLDTECEYGYKRAISYVRDNHCKEAIETKSQETYIRRFAGMLRKGAI